MKRVVTRLASLAVTAVMVAGLATGCGSDPSTASGNAASSNVTSGSTAGTSAAEGEKTAVYPIATREKPLTLKVWTGADGILKYFKDCNEVVAFQEMEKATGIHIEWIHPPIAQAIESFNLLMASRDLPDAICYPWGYSDFVIGGAAKYANDGIIVSLNDYMDNAPNFSKILSDNPEIKKRIVDDTGKIYYFSLMMPDLLLRTYNGYMIRQDWLDKTGMKMPETTDELYAVLKAFQDKDVNGSGKKDEYWSATGTDKGILGIDTLLWPFGATKVSTQENGKVIYDPMKPEFKEGVSFLAKLYSEGLIDPEYIINDDNKLQQKYITENAAGSYSSAGRVIAWNKKITPSNPNAKLVPIPSLKGPNGKSYWYEANTVNVTNPGICLAITTANKHVAETMAWQDWIYSKEGNMAFNFGREGDTYTIENGQPKFTDKITKDPKGRTQTEMLAITATMQSMWPTLGDLASTKLQKTPEEWNVFEIWGQNMPDNSRIMPPLTFNDAELAVITSKLSAINDYMKQMLDRFIMGKEPIDNWDKEFIPKLKQLGIEEVIKVNQSALDRYNQR